MPRTRAPTAPPPESDYTGLDRYYQPSARESALLILRLMQAREQELEREVSRARISQATVRGLCGRTQISNEFLVEVQEFLLAAGWVLFCLSSTHFGIIRKKAVEGWARISSARISPELNAVARGRYSFDRLEPLLIPSDSEPQQESD